MFFTVEEIAGQSKPYHKVIYRNTYSQRGQQREGWPHYPLEDSHKTNLHTHIYKVREGEAQPFQCVGRRMEGEIIGEKEIQYERDGITYDSGYYRSCAYCVNENYIHAVLY